MNHFKNIIDGARQVLVLDTCAKYVKPTRNGFSNDADILRGDVSTIAQGMRKAAKEYGKQANNR